MISKARELRVKELMIRDVITVQPGDDVQEAVTLMAENRVSAVPVVDRHNKCVGMLSTSDLVDGSQAALEGSDPDEVPIPGMGSGKAPLQAGTQVRALMERRVVSVDPEASALEAGREMVRSRVHRLVVLDQDRRLLGILSTMDLLQALTDEE
jgi:CBS domain-containing protein